MVSIAAGAAPPSFPRRREPMFTTNQSRSFLITRMGSRLRGNDGGRAIYHYAAFARSSVFPAKAGIQNTLGAGCVPCGQRLWIPAFAGKTGLGAALSRIFDGGLRRLPGFSAGDCAVCRASRHWPESSGRRRCSERRYCSKSRTTSDGSRGGRSGAGVDSS